MKKETADDADTADKNHGTIRSVFETNRPLDPEELIFLSSIFLSYSFVVNPDPTNALEQHKRNLRAKILTDCSAEIAENAENVPTSATSATSAFLSFCSLQNWQIATAGWSFWNGTVSPDIFIALVDFSEALPCCV